MVKTVFKTTGGAAKRPAKDFTIEVTPGDFVFREGDLGTEMYIVQDGQVEIVKQIDGEEKQLALLEKGDFFGEMAILEDVPRTASARSLDHAKLLQINGSTFDSMLRSNPEIAVRMMRKLSGRLRETSALLEVERVRNASGGAAVVPAFEAPREPEPMAPDEPVEAAVAAQQLVHAETGTVFPIAAGSETSVGRQDPVTGINPEVDLSDVDTDRSTSRRHAKIYRRGSKFFLTEEIGTTNGTFINGHRIETGVPFEIQLGDELQFGLVKLAFGES